MIQRSSILRTLTGPLLVLAFTGLTLYTPAALETLEGGIYGYGSKLLLKNSSFHQDEILLVEMDNLEDSRKRIGLLTDALDRGGARVIGLQIPIHQKQTNPALMEIRAFRERFNNYAERRKERVLYPWVVENLGKLEESVDYDSILLKSVRRSGKVVLMADEQGEDSETGEKEAETEINRNSLGIHDDPAAETGRFLSPTLRVPFPELAQGSLGLGHARLLVPKEGPGMVHPLVLNFGGLLLPSFPLRIAIASLEKEPSQVLVSGEGIFLDNRFIPAPDGKMRIQMPPEVGRFSRFTALDILDDKLQRNPVTGKIVIIGFSGDGKFRSEMDISPTEISAHILHSLLNGHSVSRPFWFSYLEILSILILGGGCAFYFPRTTPWAGFTWMVLLTSFVLITGLALWSVLNTWLKTIPLAFCIPGLYVITAVSSRLGFEPVTGASVEANRLLGIKLQNQGRLDQAFKKFKKIPLDKEAVNHIYTLAQEYEKQGQTKKALAAYTYMSREGNHKDVEERIRLLTAARTSSGVEKEGSAAILLKDSDPETRKRIGRYEIIEELGKGGMGLVYKALDPRINRLLVVKTICFSDEFEEDVVHEIKERFFREAEIAGQLSHPSIVTIYDVGEVGELTYIVMEFLEGDDLQRYISKKRLLPLRMVINVVAGVADALEFAHRSNVIHRDIKPGNIMLLKSGGIKVTDFGIAKAMSSSRTKTGVIMGTPNYMSPEQIMGRTIDPRSDIFSLGVVFFQLLTGETPFNGDDMGSLLHQITVVKHPSPRRYNSKIPRVCEQIIDKALEKDPQRRFRSAGEMSRYLKLVASKMDHLSKGKEE